MDIISPSNSRVKGWAQLLDKKHRSKQGKYLIEGIHLVMEALQANADIECVAYDIERGIPRELTGLRLSPDAPEWIAVSSAVIAKCTEAKTPQPVFAVVRKETTAVDRLWEKPNSIVIVLDGVQDPGNVGTIIRSADAAGAAGVVLGQGCADLYNPKTIRSTMGSMFHIPVVEGELPELLPEAKRHGAQIISMALDATHSCYTYDFRGPVWMLIGSEGQGVSAEATALVDESIRIPMVGQAESLNAAMAATIVLFEAMRQRNF